MSEKRNKYDVEFPEGSARIVAERNKPITQVGLGSRGVNAGTLGNLVNKARAEREGTDQSKNDLAESKRLRAEIAELRMERDVLKRSVVLWVKEATK